MARGRRGATRRSELKNTAYEIFIAALSILSIVNLVLVYAVAGNKPLHLVLAVMNGLLSVLFLIDFVYRVATAPNAWRYLWRGFGWADLLASVPMPQFKLLRLFRLVRVERLLRVRGWRSVAATLVHDRANSTLMTLLLLGILVLQFGSLTILGVEEHAKGSTITTASDALWYTIVTISTVGYGDRYPVTNLGRIIGALIIVLGVGIFGTFTGYLANVFVGPRHGRAEGGGAPGVADAADVTAAGGEADATAPPGDPVRRDASGPSETAPVGVLPAGPARERLRHLLDEQERMMAEIRALLRDDHDT